ncbi:hypothetical protein [Marinigracilibium pacificum]|uniref:Uncharacterized protein n=1 Tax=Marinigracilibium pacificum TaxID=2729599 RepID=A0A848IYR2_9BACT|nr:hypothetical protein [Marinigracilibium pacificum]NMM49663.1 hypothetical protein [Marinigracilibium pacificum]
MKNIYTIPIKAFLLTFLLSIVSISLSFAQCIDPIITDIGNSGPVCEGEQIQIFAEGEIGGVSSNYVRMAGIGGNFGNREFNKVFATGDRPEEIQRISEATFNSIAAGGASALHARYDILLFTWNSNTNLNVN